MKQAFEKFIAYHAPETIDPILIKEVYDIWDEGWDNKENTSFISITGCSKSINNKEHQISCRRLRGI